MSRYFRSLELAKNAGLLNGYKIHVTPHVRPPLDDMKGIIFKEWRTLCKSCATECIQRTHSAKTA